MIYTSGADAKPSPGGFKSVNATDIQKGNYILAYKVPRIAFTMISPEHISWLFSEWVKFRSVAGDMSHGSPQDTQIRGVYADTDTGEINFAVTFVPARVVAQTVTAHGTVTDVSNISEAGINYVQALAVIGILTVGALGLLTLIGVYQEVKIVSPTIAAGGLGFVIGGAVGVAGLAYLLYRR